MTGLLLNLRGIYNKDLGGAAPVFDPASLFSSGEAGVWYDPSDTSTVWATTTATIQTVAASAGVTATAGNLVAQIDDKSGNGNHATQATVAARPILRQSGGLYYLEFDGANDYLDAPGSSTDTWVAFFGCEVSNTTNKTDYGSGFAYPKEALAITFNFNGAATRVYIREYPGTVVQGTPIVESGSNLIGSKIVSSYQQSSGNHVWRRDGVLIDSSTSTLKTNALPGFISALPTSNQYTANDFYSVIIVEGNLTTQEISDTESYIAGKTGVTL